MTHVVFDKLPTEGSNQLAYRVLNDKGSQVKPPWEGDAAELQRKAAEQKLSLEDFVRLREGATRATAVEYALAEHVHAPDPALSDLSEAQKELAVQIGRLGTMLDTNVRAWNEALARHQHEGYAALIHSHGIDPEVSRRLDALEDVASTKADRSHRHSDYVTEEAVVAIRDNLSTTMELRFAQHVRWQQEAEDTLKAMLERIITIEGRIVAIEANDVATPPDIEAVREEIASLRNAVTLGGEETPDKLRLILAGHDLKRDVKRRLEGHDRATDERWFCAHANCDFVIYLPVGVSPR